MNTFRKDIHVQSGNLFPEVFSFFSLPVTFNPIALRMAKTLWSFGHSECNRVKERVLFPSNMFALFK